jgi:ATP-dependent 26S proteasome regulatory subunit
VTAGLLNLLDGVDVTFKLPTFIVATTNFPENLLESLADRPGRFDLMIELNPPSVAEKIALLEFIAKREASAEEKDALAGKGTENFSIAHIKEIVVRSRLHDKTIPVVIKELVDHSKKFKRNFEKERKGLGLGGNED